MQALIDGEVVILDGGTGTELERRGASMSPGAWCGPATLDNLELLKQIHLDYIAAGAQIVTANTYASSRIMLANAGLADRFEDLNRAAVQTARLACDESGVEGLLVAGSLSHMVPIVAGEMGSDLSRTPSGDEMDEAFGELAALHVEEGCDLIINEMMFHPNRIPHSLSASMGSGLPVWVGLSARQGENGEVLSFTDEFDVPFAEIVQMVAEFKPDSIGVMHTPSNIVGEALDIMRAHFDGPLMAYPDSGYFAMPEWQFENIIPPAELADFGTDWKSRGAQIIGGCCGLSPEHIEALAPLAKPA